MSLDFRFGLENQNTKAQNPKIEVPKKSNLILCFVVLESGKVERILDVTGRVSPMENQSQICKQSRDIAGKNAFDTI